MRSILVTGGAGFIGSHLVKYLLRKYPDYIMVNFDALTYAGNPENLKEIENLPNYRFFHGDICDEQQVSLAFEQFKITDIIHLAAESHVDRSISDPLAFIKTNVIGTVQLLQVAKKYWSADLSSHLFYHVSTDEVYGSLGLEGHFREDTPYDPRSPYSASKASSDHFVRAYANTYGMRIRISNCSNNYGPFQFPEKLIPLMINNIKNQKTLPVYGDGKNVRDWLYVEDHIRAIDMIFHQGEDGHTYNIGGEEELENIQLVHALCDAVDLKLNRPEKSSRALIKYVQDRPGHDRRYAIDCEKLKSKIGWKQEVSAEEGIKKTIAWYLDNTEWLDHVTSGAYQHYYSKQYNH